MRAKGVALVLGGSVFLSFAGLLLRHVETANGWQILFYRGISFSVTMLLMLAVRYRALTPRLFLHMGRDGLAVAIFLGVGSVFFVFAMLLTTVANAMFILSSTPFFTAVLAWALLRETVARSTWSAMAIAFVGIGFMFADGILTGQLAGIVVALAEVGCFAGMLIALRHAAGVNMFPALCLAGLITAAIALPLSGGLSISAHDLALCLLLGTVQFGAGFSLITLGTRHLPAAEVALLGLVETVLAPFWVWVGVGETPTQLTLAGGAIVLAAVSFKIVRGIKGAK